MSSWQSRQSALRSGNHRIQRRKRGEGSFYRVVELKEAGEKGGDELKDGIANTVEGGGRQLVVVVHMVPVALRLEVEGLSENLAEDCRQKLVVSDVLDLGSDDLPALLVEGLLVPVGVDGLQQGGDPVVLSHQDSVKGGQACVVVHPLVARPSPDQN